MSGWKWGSTLDGKYHIVSLTKDTLPGAMEVMRKAFFGEETVSVACELPTNPKAVAELEEMVLHAAYDGISLIAVETETGEIAAAAFNIFEFPAQPNEANYYQAYQSKCCSPNAKCLLQFMIDMGNELDIFQHYNVDCLIEIMFLATLKTHQGHGLATALFECTIQMATALKSGNDVRVSIGCELKTLMKPEVVTALCSSFATQKIAVRLGFQNLKIVDFEKWSFNGKTFAEVIGPDTKGTSIDCFVLR